MSEQWRIQGGHPGICPPPKAPRYKIYFVTFWIFWRKIHLKIWKIVKNIISRSARVNLEVNFLLRCKVLTEFWLFFDKFFFSLQLILSKKYDFCAPNPNMKSWIRHRVRVPLRIHLQVLVRTRVCMGGGILGLCGNPLHPGKFPTFSPDKSQFRYTREKSRLPPLISSGLEILLH